MSMASTAGQHRDLLRIGLDIGTGNIQIDGQHIHGDANIFDAPILPICLQGRDPRIEQTAILFEDGRVAYGIDVAKEVRDNPDLQDQVLALWKLAPHPRFGHLEEVIHVRNTLSAQNDCGAIQDFMADHLKCLLRDIRDYYKKTSNAAGKNAAYWDNIPLELQITVPAMWGDFETGLIRNAAQEALGTNDRRSKVQLREEPLCAATVYMMHLIKSDSIKEGECLLCVDCGKGTLDIATVRLVQKPSRGGTIQLQRVGNCLGDDSGSHLLNTQAWQWIRSGQCEKVRDLNHRCAQLEIPEREFLRQFSSGIDRVKNELVSTRYGLSVKIYSSHMTVGPGRRHHLDIELPRDLIDSWYKTWTDRTARLVKQHLDEHRNERYACAALTGGGSQSDMFREEMGAVLSQEPYNIEVGNDIACISMCSRGALQQHFFQEDSLPAVSHYYLGMTEDYNARRHKGAKSGGHVERSEYDPKLSVVHNRLNKIMTHRKDTFAESELIPLSFPIEADRLGRIVVFLYRTETEIANHSAAYEDDQKTLRPGIREFPIAFKDLPDLRDRGFNVTNPGGPNSKDHHELRTFVQINCDNDRLEVTIYAMRNDYRYKFEERGKEFDKRMVLFTHSQEVWNKSCSHFVLDSTGAGGKPQVASSKRKNDASHEASGKKTARKSKNHG